MTSPQWDGVAGKRVVLTGATNGIGLAAAEALAAQGAQLAIVARDQARGEQAAARARAAAPSPETTVDVVLADLTSQAEVRRLAASIAARYPAVDVLVNNAGAMFNTRRVTGDGIEQTWALNHLAPFLLTSLLLEKLGAAGAARVITTSSDAGNRSHLPFDDLDGERAYESGTWPAKGFRRYGETKLANIVFTMELARRAQGSGVSAFCYHPGNVATNFNHNNGPLMSLGMALTKPFSRSPAKGAETLIWLAESSDVANQSGGYFFDMKRRTCPQGRRSPVRRPGCGRSAKPKCEPEGGTLAGQGANDAYQVAFRVLEPRPLASIRRPSNAFLGPRLRGVVLLELNAATPHLFDGSAHFGDLNAYNLRCASCVRDFTSSFRNALCRWYSTVLGLMKSRAAISLLDLPSAALRATCNSCGVSWSSVMAVAA